MAGCGKHADFTPKVAQNVISGWFNSGCCQIPPDASDCVKFFYYQKDMVQKLIDNHLIMSKQYASRKIDFDILEQRPVLGVCRSGHAYVSKT